MCKQTALAGKDHTPKWFDLCCLAAGHSVASSCAVRVWEAETEKMVRSDCRLCRSWQSRTILNTAKSMKEYERLIYSCWDCACIFFFPIFARILCNLARHHLSARWTCLIALSFSAPEHAVRAGALTRLHVENNSVKFLSVTGVHLESTWSPLKLALFEAHVWHAQIQGRRMFVMFSPQDWALHLRLQNSSVKPQETEKLAGQCGKGVRVSANLYSRR